MATLQHKDIPDGQRHEPKGISTATAGQVYVANGSGGGAWTTTIVKYSASLTPSVVVAHDKLAEAYTVTGLTTSQTLLNIIPPSDTGVTGIGSARITGANTVNITWINCDNANATPPAGVYTFVVAV